MYDQNKSKNRLFRSLIIFAVTLSLCGIVIDAFSPFASPLSFLWLIRNALGISGVMVIFVGFLYWAKPSKQEREARK
jgi:uncharacterized membrane protein HdeD (DUF308 family)